MIKEHPNITLMKRLDLSNLAAAKDLFAENVVWHYSNPNLPDMQGDYVGLDGIRSFFETLAQKSNGTFSMNPMAITPVGDELIVVHAQNTLTMEKRTVVLDVVVVWRIVSGRIAEVWDIVPGQLTEEKDARF
jgi:predicted SnoaL-like aldol condensation-catalyzing enzyme